jgi:CRISPR-associated protein Csh1
VYPETGEFLTALRDVDPTLAETLLGKVLKKMGNCAESFCQIFEDEKGALNIKKVSDSLFRPSEEDKKKKETDRIVLVFSTVTCKSLGLERTPIRELDGYEQFIEKRFFNKTSKKVKVKSGTQQLCYATGQSFDDVAEADFAGRDGLTSLFVITTMNYATDFQKSAYHQNYQVSAEIAKCLERGSNYLLENQTCRIADIKHVIIPQFFNQDQYAIRGKLQPIKARAELLLKLRDLSKLENYLANYADVEEVYWLNFVAMDVSPGKSFKISSLIKDVSKFHFRNLLEAFDDIGKILSPWLVIPTRDKKKAKVNPALNLFTALLEQRKVESGRLYGHFSEYALCHWFKRYKAYVNIKPAEELDYALKDGVFRYLALWLVLRKLNLLKEYQPIMEKENTLTAEEISANEEAFCTGLNYSPAQQCMFYLGRVLNRVVYEQSGVKKHKKNALDKVNYNGMNKAAIIRLSEDLFEAGRHYNITSKIVWSWGKFKDQFDFNNWKMDSQEALFFILSGYTFGIKSKTGSETGLDAAEETDDESTNND